MVHRLVECVCRHRHSFRMLIGCLLFRHACRRRPLHATTCLHAMPPPPRLRYATPHRLICPLPAFRSAFYRRRRDAITLFCAPCCHALLILLQMLPPADTVSRRAIAAAAYAIHALPLRHAMPRCPSSAAATRAAAMFVAFAIVCRHMPCLRHLCHTLRHAMAACVMP